jgi:NAD(P)-dependent dehydrogenase (short-subunit alcohol dehydrogenase family)
MQPKTWFITGTASGFGRHLSTLALRRGDRVAATDRTPGALSPLAHEYGERLWTAKLDVTDTSAIRRVVADAFAHFGRIDVVVSSAGYGLFGAAEEVSDQQLLAQIDTNLVGSIQLARAVIPYFRKQGGGRMIQLSSSGGQVGDPGMSIYNATKWGIEGFYESALMELAPFGIEVTLVEPSGSRTNFAHSMISVEPIDAYNGSIVGQIRRLLSGGIDPAVMARQIAVDPAKVAQAIIDSADAVPAPKRLTLGSSSYEQIAADLRDRLADLEAKRDLAYRADADDVIAARA